MEEIDMKLEVKNLTKKFGKTIAVDDLSFSLSSGDVLGFIGPNGSGKTTTMNIISSLYEPTSGDILIDGKSIIDYPETARQIIGFMPDYLPNQTDITAHEYIDFFARAFGYKGTELDARVCEVEDFTGVTQIRDKVISTLSRGMKQRVSLARALVNDPSLLIMDEPANGLDPRARIEFRGFAKKLAQKGKAILIASHILADLSEICSECIIIEKGKLVKKIEENIKGVDLENIFMEMTKGDLQ